MKNCCGFPASQAKAKWKLWTTHTALTASLCLSPSTAGEQIVLDLSNGTWKPGFCSLQSSSYMSILKAYPSWKVTCLQQRLFFLILFNVYSQIWAEAKILFYSCNLHLSTSLSSSQSMFRPAMAELLSSWPLVAPTMVWTTPLMQKTTSSLKAAPGTSMDLSPYISGRMAHYFLC